MIRILHVEDDPCDAELVEYELAKLSVGFELHRVYDLESYERQLRTAPPDVILADHRVPAFGGQDALRVAKQLAPGVPFVLITGTLDDETAVAYLKAGAVNYILKDHLARLPSAVENALVEAERERQLEWQRALLQAVLSAAPSPITVQDADGRLLLANRAVAEAYGVPLGELEGAVESALELDEAEVAERARARDEVLASGRTSLAPEEPVTDRAGVTRWFQVVRSALEVANRNGDLVLAVGTDISERRRLLEAIPDAFLMVGPDRRIERANVAAETLFGRSREDLAGCTVDELLPNLDAGQLDPPRLDVSAEGLDAGLVVKASDGTEIAVEVHRAGVELAGGMRLLLVIRDVRPRRALERQLLMASRLESVGRLAGGVAHDFNNLLTVILAHAEMLLAGDELPASHREALEEIGDTARRGGDLTRQLLAFSRRQVLQPRVIDLNAIVTGMGKMLPRVLGEDVAMRLDLEPQLGTTRADPGQIEQVVMNLVVNARDALRFGGQLGIETANHDVGEDEALDRRPMTPGRFVRLSVVDAGAGMDEETVAKAFDPFFTTKGEAGTGLGLATVYGIVKQSGGFVWIDSAPGRGTRVDVLLPRLDERPDVASPAAPASAPVGGQETILLVEDEEKLRRLVRRGLERYGYRVFDAGSATAARSLASELGGQLDLLLTDVILPDGSGLDLGKTLRRELPGLAVLFTSGYAGEALVDQQALDLDVHFLQKPYTSATLAHRVRMVLDTAGGARGAAPPGAEE